MNGHIFPAIITVSLLMTITSVVYAAAPVTDFSGTPISGPAPLTVYFTDKTSNTPTGWAWFFGDDNFKTPWTQMTAHAEWTPRNGHSSVLMPDGSVVLMGGANTFNDCLNDTWRSTDYGITWTQVNGSSGWTARRTHNSVLMPDGTIVLIGGCTGPTGGCMNDVWQSPDQGETWTLVNASTGWTPREEMTIAVVSDGSIIVYGGTLPGGFTQFNDVWRSNDKGTTWTQVIKHAEWVERSGYSTTVLRDGSILLTGGNHFGSGDLNDVWRSNDNGATWTQMTAHAEWTPRNGHSSVLMPDGSVVLMGGYSDSYMNDTWRSTDNGATWTQMTAHAEWDARSWYSSIVMLNGSTLLMGGVDGVKSRNDVWNFQPAGSTAQSPSHMYTKPGTYNVSLQAYNDDGSNSIQKAEYITVTPPPSLGIGVFRSGQWILDNGMDRIVDRRFQYGLASDTPVAGDFNNDGTTDIGVYRSGQWILDYGMDRIVDRRFQYGLASDTPVVGDFNNDGTTDNGVYRSGQWILDYRMDGTVDRRFQYGQNSDKPVIGDFNNDGTTEIGLFRSGQWILNYGMYRFHYGLATDIPIVGDFNNDGLADIGVFRSGQWILDYGTDGTVDRRFQYGLATDIPIVGIWV